MRSHAPGIFVWYCKQHSFHHSNFCAMTTFETLETALEPIENQEENNLEIIEDVVEPNEEEEAGEEEAEQENEEEA